MGREQRHTNRRGRAFAGLVLSSLLVAAACGGDDDDAATSAEAPADDAGAEMSVAEGAGGDEFLASDDAGEGAAADRAGSDFDIGVVGRDVIIEMRVVLSSDDIQRTVASVMAAASTFGGGVASSEVNYGDQADPESNEGYAVLVVKVPPESVDRLLAGLDDTATVRSIDQSAQDVTEQLVDLDVRISNARQSVATVREFMDRTENLNELVTLESELTRRQTELERLEAQQRNLADRVALSTVTIEIVPTAAVPEPVVEEEQGVGDALRSGWNAFVAVVVALVIVLATVLPFLVAGGLLFAIGWWVMRRRDLAEQRRLSAPSTPAPMPIPDPPADVESDTVSTDDHEPVG